MARYFITGFTGGSGGQFGVTGQLIDQSANVNTGLSVDYIQVDLASASTVRQQIEAQLVPALNEQLVSSSIDLILVDSDIEYVC
jgi:hypothetical protein